MKSVTEGLKYQIGGEQSVTLLLTGSEQTLPAGCVCVYPNESGCTISSLKRSDYAVEGSGGYNKNYATELGMAGVDYSSVKPFPKFVEGAFDFNSTVYTWLKITGTAGGRIELIFK